MRVPIGEPGGLLIFLFLGIRVAAEFEAIESMLADGIRPRVLAVEFDEIGSPLDGVARSWIEAVVERLAGAGYGLVAVDGPNYTFLSGQVG